MASRYELATNSKPAIHGQTLMTRKDPGPFQTFASHEWQRSDGTPGKKPGGRVGGTVQVQLNYGFDFSGGRTAGLGPLPGIGEMPMVVH